MPITGIIDESYVQQQVQATAGLNTGSSDGFDPNLFLKVLTATLANQSPFDTMDTTEILNTQAKLAQVEQGSKQVDAVEEMRDTLNTQMATVNNSLADIQAAILTIADRLGDQG